MNGKKEVKWLLWSCCAWRTVNHCWRNYTSPSCCLILHRVVQLSPTNPRVTVFWPLRLLYNTGQCLHTCSNTKYNGFCTKCQPAHQEHSGTVIESSLRFSVLPKDSLALIEWKHWPSDTWPNCPTFWATATSQPCPTGTEWKAYLSSFRMTYTFIESELSSFLCDFSLNLSGNICLPLQ